MIIITINENNKVISQANGSIFTHVKPDNFYSFAVDKIPTISAEEELYFNPITREFYTGIRVAPDKATLKLIRQAEQQKKYALQWLADNDWKINKRSLNEWSEDDWRWINYLETRAQMRASIDEAETIIKNLKS